MECGEVGRWNGLQMISWKNHERQRKNNLGRYHQKFKKNPHYKRQSQIGKLKQHYNLSPKAYLHLFAVNDGGCHLCNKPVTPYTNTACVDHEPGTGYVRIGTKLAHTGKPANVRGILCPNCNRMMSAVDRPEWLLKAIDYASRTNVKE